MPLRPSHGVLLLFLAAACGGNPSGPGTPRVARVTLTPASLSLTVNATGTLTAVATDSRGAVVSGQGVTWTSTSEPVATVSATGVVTAVGIGQADIRATMDGVTGSARVTVVGVPNLVISNVWLTQGTQRPDRSIPLVVGGRSVLVNVSGTLTQPFTGALPTIRVQVSNGAGGTHEDVQPMNGQPGPVPDEGRPVHQVVIPAALVGPDLRVTVTANPGGAVPEASLSDNQWPASGTPPVIPVRTVQPLEVHLVPIRLTQDGTVGPVTPDNLDEYLLATRQMFPWAGLSVTIGPVFSTDVAFGGGTPAAWVQILPQLDLLRVTEGTSRYYVGSLRPAPGVTFVQNGGWGYIPANPASIGPATRTSLVVGVGWFNRQRQTTELVAHELAHNHGRLHAPCGNPAGVDAGYPHPSSGTGVWTHDLYRFETGLTGSVLALSPAEGFDLLSYCQPVWTSDYTYLGLLNARSQPVSAAPGAPCDCLLIGGTVSPDGVTLAPVFRAEAYTALPERPGGHWLEGLDAAGQVIFRHGLDPTPVDHAPGVAQFLVALPRELAGGDRLASIRLVDPRGRTAFAPQGTSAAAPLAARRLGGDRVEVTWDPRAEPGVLVRDPATGRVLGIGQSGRLVVLAPGGAVDVIASRGVQSRRERLVPR